MNKGYQEPVVQDIADAIREKNGLTVGYKIAEMPQAIRNLGSSSSLFLQMVERSIISVEDDTAVLIGNSAFRWASSLNNVFFSRARVIGADAFRNTSNLRRATFMEVDTIDGRAFQESSRLETLVIGSNRVARLIDTNAFIATPIFMGAGYIYVPENLVDAYKTAQNWRSFASQIKPMTELP